MKKATKTEMRALLKELRGIAPKRPLTYGESLQVARIQAARLRRWAAAHQPDINLVWLVKQRLIPVSFVPSYRLGEQSGATTLHAKLGRGNAKVQATQIELIANDFAAHVLMPTSLVKREWFAWRELSIVATIFNVSVEAMATRLEKLGIISRPRPLPRTYFRRLALAEAP